jgi:HAMP domain-containing protein
MAGLLVAIVALAVSVVSLVRARRVEGDQKSLRRVTEELTRKQLEAMGGQEIAAKRARVVASLEKTGQSSWKFFLTNYGPAVARHVTFELIDCEHSPLIRNDVAEKIPVRILQPGSQISLIAAITMGTPRALHAKVGWTNEDDTSTEKEFTLGI